MNPTNPPENKPRDEVLAHAWELYETYSSGSAEQKKQNSAVRRVVIMLIFLTSTFAVISTLPGMEFAAPLLLYGISQLGLERTFNFINEQWHIILSTSLIILSVATTAMLSYASQFTPMKAWIMYRVGADRIRSEIYRYRMQAGKYKDFSLNTREARELFRENIENINQQIYELETAPPFLQLMGSDKPVRPEPSTPRRMVNALFAPIDWLIAKPLEFLFSIPKRIRQIGKPPKPRSIRLPGRYFPEHDDGFNALTGEDYLNYRAIPQRDWYVKKVYEDYEKIRDWRIVLLTIGGASAVLAAIQLEPYIVITTAAAVAINTHVQLNLIGSTYGNYHITAARLDSEIVRWRNAENRESREEVRRLVETIEQILEDERVVWMQQASQAQNETEQVLLKEAGKRTPSVEPTNVIDLDKDQRGTNMVAQGESATTQPAPTQAKASNTSPTKIDS